MTSRAAAVLAAAAVLVAACTSAVPAARSPSPSTGASAGSTPTASPSPAISAEWTEYHGGPARAGAGPPEPGLSSPQLAWRAAVDADVYASPLIVEGHVIVATENNTVYSLDLFTGDVVWKINLGAPVDASTLPCGNIGPVTGITGTPAADVAGGRLYVATYQRSSHRHVLFALHLTDGSVAWRQDLDPAGSTPAVEQLRGALAIGSGFVYVPFGGLFGDCGPFRGYLVAVPLDGGATRSFAVPSPRGASIWSPQGASVGSDGSVYVVTGNATATTDQRGLSDSVVQLSADLSTVRSYFTPSNWAELNAGDTDLGSVGATLLPGGRVFSIGKEGVAYVLREGALGGVGGQLASRKVCSGAWGGTAWTGDLVYVPCIDGLYAVRVGDDSSLAVAWHAPHPTLGSPIVSAGAVWALEPSTGTLYAFDPASGRTLFSTHLAAAMHFSTPAATDGFVVVPAGKTVYSVLVAS